MDLHDSQARLIRAEREPKMARENLFEVQEQSTESVKAANQALRQLTEMSTRAQALVVEDKYLRPKMDKAVQTRDDAISSASKKGQEVKMVEWRNGLLKDKLDSLKQKESFWYDMGVVNRKIEQPRGEVTNLFDRLRHYTSNTMGST